jgi:hypothetical protein
MGITIHCLNEWRERTDAHANIDRRGERQTRHATPLSANGAAPGVLAGGQSLGTIDWTPRMGRQHCGLFHRVDVGDSSRAVRDRDA